MPDPVPLTLSLLLASSSFVVGCHKDPAIARAKATAAQQQFYVATSREQQDAAVQLLDDECRDGEMTACAYLGEIYIGGSDGFAPDPAKARPMVQRACNAKVMRGCTALAGLYARGIAGLERNSKEALRLLELTCSAGDFMGCTVLAPDYDPDDGSSDNVVPLADRKIAKTAELYERGCILGGVAPCLFAGQLYEGGEKVPVDLSKARDFYQKACELGLKLGCENMARLGEPPQDPSDNTPGAVDRCRSNCVTRRVTEMEKAGENPNDVPGGPAMHQVICQQECEQK